MRKQRQRARAGEGSVFERNGKWVAMISIGGRANRRKVRRVRHTEPEAWEALRKLRVEYQEWDASDERPRPLKDHIDAWLALTKRKVRPKTYVTYELTLRLHVVEFDKVLSAMVIDRIKPTHIAALFAALEEKKRSPRVRELVFLRLRSVFKRALAAKSIKRMPIDADHRVTVPRPKIRFWTAEQARTFLEATAGDWLAALYRLALSVGMRRGELLGLQWTDLDLKARRLSLQQQLNEYGKLADLKTPRSVRTIELPQKAVDALLAQREKLMAAGLRASAWVFPDEDGRHFRARKFNLQFAAAVAKAKVPRVTPHGMRHTIITLKLSQGESPVVVAEMVGDDVKTLMSTYAHALPGAGRESADRLDAIL